MARLLRGAAVAALVGGATASLSACSGDPGPIVTESPSATLTVATTLPPTPTPSMTSEEELLAQIPENARGEDFASASNFAKFFVRLYPQMMREKDPRLFRLLSDDDCLFCNNALEQYQQLVDSNQTMIGGDVTAQDSLASGGLEADGTMNASFDAASAARTYLDLDGNVISTFPGQSGRFGVNLRYQDGHWVVLGVGSADQ